MLIEFYYFLVIIVNIGRGSQVVTALASRLCWKASGALHLAGSNPAPGAISKNLNQPTCIGLSIQLSKFIL